MRELKFRLFHNDTNCMYVDSGLTTLGLNGAIREALKNRYIIMQYIGRKDVNNVEIYEDDYIQLSCECCFYRIVWNNKLLCYEPIDDGKSQKHKIDINVWDYQIEVIGNIHENPEILENFN